MQYFRKKIANLLWQFRGKPRNNDWTDWFRVDFVLFGIILLILYFFYCRNIYIRFACAISILLFFLNLIFKKRKRLFPTEFIAVLILSILIGFGPIYLREQIKNWNEKLLNSNIVFKVTKDGFAFTVNTNIGTDITPDSIIDVKPISKEIKLTQVQYAKYREEETAKATESIIKQQLEKNIINNGDFSIPLMSEFSKWGSGLYSNRINAFNSGKKCFWINFLNADIEVTTEKTEIGPALKIINKSPSVDNSCGLMEQYIQIAEPGKYRLSFWAKAPEDFEPGGLWLSTRDNWQIDENENIAYGYSLKEKAPFGWKQFSKDIIINEAGLKTFSIISLSKGTIYITNISLVKISAS